MNVTAVIAEYNPFHNGHAYQLEQIRKTTNSDYIVVVMSGDFVQRGEPAIIDKYARAQMAVKNGADLVLELPVLYSTGSAYYFAKGAVSILNDLNCIHTLCFGAELDDPEAFLQIGSILFQEPDGYRKLLTSYLKKGFSFPAAREKALKEYTGQDCSILNGPNNILGLEYTRCILQSNSSIRIMPLKRIGESYHSETLSTFSSATAVRKALQQNHQGTEAVIHAVPDNILSLYQEAIIQNRFLFSDDLSPILSYLLLKADNSDRFTDIFDMNHDLANRIYQKRDQMHSFTQFSDLIKTKNETLMHINRVLLHMILDIRQPSKLQEQPAYTRILGFKKEASPLLRKLKETSSIPVLSKLGSKELSLSPPAADQFVQSTFASNLYQSLLSQKTGTTFKHEYTRQIPIL